MVMNWYGNCYLNIVLAFIIKIKKDFFIPMTKKTILILDKESHIQWTLKTFLEGEQYIVISVNTIDRALRNFSEFKVSGLITEYWIDHSRTLETIQEFKKMFPEAYVMMLTNNEVVESEYEEIMNSGVDDYFIKPLSFNKILLHLRKGLKQHNIFPQKNQEEQGFNRINRRKKFEEGLSAEKNLISL